MQYDDVYISMMMYEYRYTYVEHERPVAGGISFIDLPKCGYYGGDDPCLDVFDCHWHRPVFMVIIEYFSPQDRDRMWAISGPSRGSNSATCLHTGPRMRLVNISKCAHSESLPSAEPSESVFK
jgi:hypothetical protein